MKSVSCLCPTFARTALLEEAIESFLRQDYAGPSELIVLNDFDRQTLRFHHPRVRVVNTSRYETLGEKRNAMVEMSGGELLLTWGDDDIHLPHRISRMVEALGDGPMCMEGWHFCSYAGKMMLNRFSTSGAMICTRSAFHSVKGIPHEDVGEDQSFSRRIRKHFGLPTIPMATENPAFWYRWSGTDRPHISAHGPDAQGKPKAYTLMHAYALAMVAKGTEPSEEIELHPCWRGDHIATCASAK